MRKNKEIIQTFNCSVTEVSEAMDALNKQKTQLENEIRTLTYKLKKLKAIQLLEGE